MLCSYALVSDIYRYVSLWLGKVAGDIGHFKIVGHPDNTIIILKKYFIWDMLGIAGPT